jgi:hypothetical protein
MAPIAFDAEGRDGRMGVEHTTAIAHTNISEG